MNTTHISLLVRLRQPGQAEAWGQFVELYTPLLHAWARRLGLADADVEDLVQDVFVVLARELPRFDYQPQRGSFRGWLKTIAVNRWRELQRKRRASSVGEEVLAELPAPQDEPFWEVEYRQYLVSGALRLLRGEFSDVTWQAFERYMIEDRDAAMVAAELGVSVGTVYAAKSRVLARLREELDGLFD